MRVGHGEQWRRWGPFQMLWISRSSQRTVVLHERLASSRRCRGDQCNPRPSCRVRDRRAGGVQKVRGVIQRMEYINSLHVEPPPIGVLDVA